MSFDLPEKATFDLQEKDDSGTEFYIGGDWKTPAGIRDSDLDFSAIAVMEDGSTVMAYYGKQSPSRLKGGVVCGDDEQEGGDGDSATGDAEHILIDTAKLDAAGVKEVYFVANIYKPAKLWFNQMQDVHVRICQGHQEAMSPGTSTEMARSDLSQLPKTKAFEFGMLSKNAEGHWTFTRTDKVLHEGSDRGSRLDNIQPLYGTGRSASVGSSSSSGGSITSMVIGGIILAAAVIALGAAFG